MSARVFIRPLNASAYEVLWRKETLIRQTRLPFFDSARALLARGQSGAFEMWDFTRPHPRMTGVIERAALYTVEDSAKGLYRRKWRTVSGSDGGLAGVS
jgi:hypothetical protein